jgi:short-subunit dehydrogenase
MSHSHIKHKTIWLIGASEGIGLELCRKLLDQGHYVIASSRSAEQNTHLTKLRQVHSNNLNLINLDVTDDQSIEQAMHQLDDLNRTIDTWIYNAGAYDPLTLEQWTLKKFTMMNEVNYLGAVRLMLKLKPLFLENGGGSWIWNISLASDIGLPYGGAYSAPKAALMNLAESIQPELQTHGIELKVINHGFVKTRLTAKNDFTMLGLMDSNTAAEKIIKAMQSNQFETRFPWNLSFIMALLKRLPKSWTLFLTQKMLKKS